MEFKDEYFDDEVREGFYISGFMKRYWAAQLEVLQVIADLCDRHNIKWFADGGTLLGAVRHKGFIPWDDDVDICMLRDDYDRFLEICKTELPKGYTKKNMHEKESWDQSFLRINNSSDYVFDDEFLEKYHNMYHGVGVDVFVLDYVAADEEVEEAKRYLLLALASLQVSEDDEFRGNVYKSIEEFTGIVIDRTLPRKNQIICAVEAVSKTISRQQASGIVNSVYYINDRNCKCDIHAFDSVIKLPFENIMINAPIGYDAYLRMYYGDYMKLVKACDTHDYPAFMSNEIHFKKASGSYPFWYEFNKEHLINNRLANVCDRVKITTNLNIKLLQSIIASNLEINDVREILLNCQQSAISIGKMLEQLYGNENDATKILEQYCEKIYEVYINIETNDNLDIEQLLFLLENVEKKTEEIYNNNKEVVFLCYRNRFWNKFDGIWKKCIENGYKVTVIPLPYYTKNAIGELTDLHYDIDGFPDYVELTHYEDYDIELHHPEIIVSQNPYDECNYTTSVPPYFYSENIKKFTERLIYIPYFTMDEIEEDDYKANQTMMYFCTVPGVVHADEVYVQSERMRRKYIERMTEFAGKETEEVWESKIRAEENIKI